MVLFLLLPVLRLCVVVATSAGANSNSNFDGGNINRSLILSFVLTIVEFIDFFDDDDDNDDFFDDVVDTESKDTKEFDDFLDDIGVLIFCNVVGVLVLLDGIDLLGVSIEVDSDDDCGTIGEEYFEPVTADTALAINTESDVSFTTGSGFALKLVLVFSLSREELK